MLLNIYHPQEIKSNLPPLSIIMHDGLNVMGFVIPGLTRNPVFL
jgi:hypothetical protein